MRDRRDLSHRSPPSGASSTSHDVARMVRRGVVALVALPGAAAAHTADAGGAESWYLHWSFEPWVVACLALSAALYLIGIYRLWHHAGRGRGVSPVQAAAFAGGWAFLVVALLSPLDPLGNQLFSAHMVQHETLMLLAAPLLVLGRPLAAWAWALPFQWRRATGGFFHARAWRTPWLVLTGPVSAWSLHALALWLWHLPVLFEAALASEVLHSFQHITFLFTALLFWWSVLGATTHKDKGIALVSILTTFVHTGALGALLTLAQTDWYPSYAATTAAFGLTPLEDQQIGGLVMWIPAGAVYVISGLLVAASWMNPGRRPAARLA